MAEPTAEEENSVAESLEYVLGSIEQTPYFMCVGSAADQLKILLEQARQDGKDVLTKKVQFELDIFCLEVTHPFINPDYSNRFVGRYGLSDGTEWPDINSFSEEQLAYYEFRLGECQNTFMKARYADVLYEKWTKSRKMNRHELGIMLVNLLGETAQAHSSQLEPNYPGCIWDIARILDVALSLNDQDLLITGIGIIMPILKRLDHKDLRWVYEISLVMKGISQKSLGQSLQREVYERIKDAVADAKDFFWTSENLLNWHRNFCRELIHWRKLLDGDEETIRSIHLEIGQSFELEAEIEGLKCNSRILDARILEDALAHYIEIGALEKVKELKKRVFHVYMASNHEFREFSHTIEIPMHTVDGFLQPFKELELCECIKIIASDSRFLVDTDAVERRTRESRAQHPLLFRASQFMVDRDRKVYEGNSDDRSFNFFASLEYRYEVLIRTELLLKSLFEFLITERGMTADNLLDFFKSGNFTDPDTDFFFEAGVKRFFCQDYVSALHILVPRLESFVKRVLARVGLDITSVKSGTTQHEQTFNQFLEREDVREKLGGNLYKYLKMVMVDQLGFNLRNDIAHGLIEPSACNENNVLIIIHLFLILKHKQPMSVGHPV